jgi:hypothetical protein
MAQINRLSDGRVLGTKVGVSPSSSKGPRASKFGLTPEQIAERELETQLGYQAWRAEREARKAKRYDARARRNNGL